ncbi:trans-2,3-dihydro-3-hydroxyanthranilate isomerase [Microdochium nivale]|nr:trans-2,3-dihydro-3-hydroxyanthranilate isomerase [Microdochium nivale]
MELPFATLDVFTTTRLAGNPLAVVTVPRGLRGVLTQADKLRVAREFNLSETVFLHEAEAAGDDGDKRHVDIFTTSREIPFAGHPTIGTAVWCLHHEVGAAAGVAATGRGGRGRALETLVTKAGPIRITSSAFSITGPPPNVGSSAAAVAAGHFVSAQIPHNVRIHANKLGDVLRAGTAATEKVARKPIPVAGGTAWILAPPSSSSSSSSSSEGSEAISRGLSSDPATRAAELAAPVVSIVNGMTFLLVKLDSLQALGAVAVGTGLDLDKFGDGTAGGSVSAQLLDEGWRNSLVSRYYYVDAPPPSLLGKEKEERVEEDRGARVRHLRTRMLEANVEDPATGSAASALACYLSLTEEKDLEARDSADGGTREAGGGGGSSSNRKFVMTQGVEMGRESVISVETTTTRKQGGSGGSGGSGGDVEIGEVHLGGTAVVVMKGVLTL